MSRKQDFTLVELVIVVVCFVGLVLVIFGCGDNGGPKSKSADVSGYIDSALNRARESAHQTNCKGNLNQIGKALRMYAGDQDGQYPSGPANAGRDLTEADFYTATGRAGGFELLRVNNYLSDHAVYVCPSTSVTPGCGNDSLTWQGAAPNLSYAYQPGLVDGTNTATGLAGTGVCADLTGDGVASNGGKANHAKFGNIHFLDGHVRGVSGLGWFSPKTTGYEVYAKGTTVMTPNTLRDPKTGEAR